MVLKQAKCAFSYVKNKVVIPNLDYIENDNKLFSSFNCHIIHCN